MSLGDNFVESNVSSESTHGKDVADLLLQDSRRGQMLLAQNEKGTPDITSSAVPIIGYEAPAVLITGTGMAAPIAAARKALELQGK